MNTVMQICKYIASFLIFITLALFQNCTSGELDKTAGDETIKQLEDWLQQPVDQRSPLESHAFADVALTKRQADQESALLLADQQTRMTDQFDLQWKNRVIQLGSHAMPFFYKIWGDEPPDGRSLFISLHGGGGAPASVNDQQWDNQKRLYDQTMRSLEGVYLAPRAPTNTWNLWHQGHIDPLFNILIQMAIIKENVNPNKVYLMGYSAGGDGVFQLAPRMGDRWAAAAMMAGHPNETSPLGLKNTPFTLHMGARDDAYNRNSKAYEWKVLLDSLQNDAPGYYQHDVQIHEGLGHWMQLKDAVALPWMKQFTRDPIPKSIVWKQDNVHHKRFFWLGIPEDQIKTGGVVRAEYHPVGNEIIIIEKYSAQINLFMNDDMLHLDEPVTIKYQGEVIYHDKVDRTILNLNNSLSDKGDANLAFSGIVHIDSGVQ